MEMVVSKDGIRSEAADERNIVTTYALAIESLLAPVGVLTIRYNDLHDSPSCPFNAAILDNFLPGSPNRHAMITALP